MTAMVVAILIHLYMRSHEVNRATERRQYRFSWHREVNNLDLDVAEDNSGDYETVRKDRHCTMKKQVGLVFRFKSSLC